MRVPRLPRLAAVALVALALGGCFLRSDEPDEDAAPEGEPRGAASDTASEPGSDAAVHVVARGDTLYGIAFRHHLDWRDLAAWNAIAAPYTIYPGQRLRLAAGGAVAKSERAADAGTAQVFAIGETKPSASERASPEAAARERESGPPKPPRAEPKPQPQPQQEKAAEPERMPPPSRIQSTPPDAEPKAEPKPPAPEPRSIEPKPATPEPKAVAPEAKSEPAPDVAAPAETNAATNLVGGIAWRWPAKGTLTQRFLPGDPAHQGINLQTRPGTPVNAAADGEVVYSGNGLVGYGELIIVKHSGEYLSAYGGSGKRLVSEGAKVKAGTPLAEAGRTGAVHFEIRKAGKPIDPASVLPPR